MGYGIGQPVRRVEDKRFVTGKGRYVDDIRFADLVHAAIVMSPHAHAKIRSIDVTAARTAPGVLTVLTGADLDAEGIGKFPPLFMPEDAGGPPGFRTARPALCTDRVRCVGDRVAFVVAETLAQARDAAEMIDVDYEPLPVVVTVEDAVAADAPKVWDECPDNISVTLRFGDKSKVEEAFSRAHLVVSRKLVNNRLAPNALEPRCSVGVYDEAEGAFTLYASSQNPHGARTMLATALLRIPEIKLRVIAPDVGGGFGLKADPYPEDLLVLLAARRCGRPVKYLATRSESLIADTHGRDQVVTGEMALDENGRILAVRSRALHALGAYAVSAVMAQLNFGCRLITNVYDIQTIDLAASAVFTNTAPLGVYRGAGRPEAVYLIERLMDEAAFRLDLDQAEIRRRNFIKSDQMPYLTPTFYKYDSGEFDALLTHCLADADWDGFPRRRAKSARRGRLRGRAVTSYIELAGVFNDRMELRFDPSGGVTIVAGTHSHGQGHATVFSQLVSEWLGIPFERVSYLQGDTAVVPFGRGTYAARSAMLGGNALRVAADTAIERARRLAAHFLKIDASEVDFDGGLFRARGTNRTMPMTEVVKAFYYKGGIPIDLGLSLDSAGTWGSDNPNFPNGCHICEVEVDPATGVPTIDRYFVIDDTGRALNPMICEGQIVGGLAQGIGQALMECVVYERETGQLVSGTFTDYCMPRIDDFTDFHLVLHNVPCKRIPLGVKGVGESGAIGAPPTVINAILDALRERGVEHIDMPATPARIWQALREAAIVKT